MKVSICIPSWFEENQHGRYGNDEVFNISNICMKRLKETLEDKKDIEIILVDNGSTLKGTEDYWKMADKLIVNENNKGFAPAMNQSLKEAEGDYIIAMNNDILVYGKNWLNNLLKIYEENLSPKVGLVMPNIIKKQFQKDCIGNDGKISFEKLVKLKEEDIILRNENIYEIKAEFGSMFCMTREVLDKVRNLNSGYEFYDERFKWGYGEDRHLYDQVRELGYETYRSNKLRVAHVGGLSMSKIKAKEGVREAIDSNRELLKKLREKKYVI